MTKEHTLYCRLVATDCSYAGPCEKEQVEPKESFKMCGLKRQRNQRASIGLNSCAEKETIIV